MRTDYKYYLDHLEREVVKMPLHEFVFEYKVLRREPRTQVAKRTGIPEATLRRLESMFLVEETVIRRKEPVAR